MKAQPENKQLHSAEYWLMMENRMLQNRPGSFLSTQILHRQRLEAHVSSVYPPTESQSIHRLPFPHKLSLPNWTQVGIKVQFLSELEDQFRPLPLVCQASVGGSPEGDTLGFSWPKEQLNANTHLENALFSFLFFSTQPPPPLSLSLS